MYKKILCLFILLTTITFAKEDIILQSFEYPPYLTGNINQMGIAEEILDEIFNHSKYHFKIVSFPTARAKHNFDNNSNSIIALSENAFKNEYAQKKYFGVRFLKFRFAYLIRNETKDIVNIDDLKNYTVGEILGSSFINTNKFYAKNIEEVLSHKQNIEKLYTGRNDAMHAIDFTLYETINQYYPKEKEFFKFATYSEYSYAVLIIHNERKDLAEFVKLRLKEIINNGKYDEIVSKYYKNKMSTGKLMTLEEVE